MITSKNSMASSTQQFGKIWPQCVVRAWQDAEFREALKRDPAGTLREVYQFAFPGNVKLEIVEGSEPVQATQTDTLRMVIPPAPSMDLQQVALIGADNGMASSRPWVQASFTT